MDKLNGDYWQISGRRSRKPTSFLIEEHGIPEKIIKKRSRKDNKNDEVSAESISPPRKKSKLTHKRSSSLNSISEDYPGDQNINPNVQGIIRAPEIKVAVSSVDATSEKFDQQGSDLDSYGLYDQNSLAYDGPLFGASAANNTNLAADLVLSPSVDQDAAKESRTMLAVPSVDKEFDSPVKEIKFSFPSDDTEATQATSELGVTTDAIEPMQTESDNKSFSDTINMQAYIESDNSHPVEEQQGVEKIPVQVAIKQEPSEISPISNESNNAISSNTAPVPTNEFSIPQPIEKRKARVIEDDHSQPKEMDVDQLNESQIIDEIAEANETEVVTVHTNNLSNNEVSVRPLAPQVDLGSDLATETNPGTKGTLDQINAQIPIQSLDTIDLTASVPKEVTEDKTKKKEKNSGSAERLKALVREFYPKEDYIKYKNINKNFKQGKEQQYFLDLIGFLRTNELALQKYVAELPAKYQQMCVDVMHMEQSDESEVHELSQEMINADRPATRSQTGPILFGLQKEILENPEIATEVLPAFRDDFVADEDDYGLTQNTALDDAPRADNWVTPTSKKEKQKKMSALQKLKYDKEQAKNKPKVKPAPKSNVPTRYVLPKFNSEERHTKKSTKVTAAGYNIDGGVSDDSEGTDYEDTQPADEAPDSERDLTLPAYGPDFIVNDFQYGFNGGRAREEGDLGRAPKSPTKAKKGNNSGSPVKDKTAQNRLPTNNQNNGAKNRPSVSPTKNSSGSNTNYSNNNNRSPTNLVRSKSGNNNNINTSPRTTPTKDTSNRSNNNNQSNNNYGYSNNMPSVPIQTTLDRSIFSTLPKSAGDGFGSNNNLMTQPQNNNNNVYNNVDSSPVQSNNNAALANQIHSSPPAQQYTGPKIKIFLNIPAIGKKNVITCPTEDNDGKLLTVAWLKDHISRLNNVEVIALAYGEYEFGSDTDTIVDLFRESKEEVLVKVKDVKKSLAILYREACRNEGLGINERLCAQLEHATDILPLIGPGMVGTKDIAVLSKCIEASTLKEIHLSGNALGNGSIVDLARLLARQYISLKKLNLAKCHFGDQAVLTALIPLVNLQDLNISGNPFSDSIGGSFVTAVLLKLANLTNLDISQCGFGPATMKALEDSRYFDIGIFPQNRGLTCLTVSNNVLRSTGVNHLTAAVCQRSGTIAPFKLVMQKVEISENDQNHCSKSLHKLMVAKNANLIELDLSYNQFTKKMQWIWQGVNDSSQLQILKMKECALTADSFNNFSNAIQFSKSLTSLDLSGNSLGKFGSDLIAKMLHESHTLQQLYLNNCYLTTVGLLNILKAANSQSTTFNLSRLELCNNCDKKFQEIQYGERILTDTFAKLNKKLLYLDISQNQINDDDVKNALKTIWEDLHGEGVKISTSTITLRFMKIKK